MYPFVALFTLFLFNTVSTLDCPVGYTVIESCHKVPPTTPQSNIRSSITSQTTNDQNDWLGLLNSFRKNHNSPPLSISKELLADAQNVAKKCTLDSSSPSSFGQTSYMEYLQSAGSNEQVLDQLFTKAISAWYKTIEKYDFSNPQFSSSSGHATQLLWKSTSQIGCGIQLCKEQRNSMSDPNFFYFVVCSFYQPGNVKGTFELNVFPKVN